MAKNVINNKILCKFALEMSNQTPEIESLDSESFASTPSAAPTAADTEAAQMPKSNPLFKCLAWLGALTTLGAWLALIFNGSVSFWLAVVGLVLASVGAKSPRGLVRDMAITAIVASAVLLVVFAIFFGALYYLDKSLG